MRLLSPFSGRLSILDPKVHRRRVGLWECLANWEEVVFLGNTEPFGISLTFRCRLSCVLGFRSHRVADVSRALGYACGRTTLRVTARMTAITWRFSNFFGSLTRTETYGFS